MHHPARKMLNSRDLSRVAGRGSSVRPELPSMSEEHDSLRKSAGQVKQNLSRVSRRVALLQCAQSLRESGLIPRSRILVKNALLNGFVEGRGRFPVNLLGSSLVALSQALPHAAECASQARCARPVAFGSFHCLTGALQRRKMIRHGSQLPSIDLDCSRRIFGVRPNYYSTGATRARSNRYEGNNILD